MFGYKKQKIKQLEDQLQKTKKELSEKSEEWLSEYKRREQLEWNINNYFGKELKYIASISLKSNIFKDKIAKENMKKFIILNIDEIVDSIREVCHRSGITNRYLDIHIIAKENKQDIKEVKSEVF